MSTDLVQSLAIIAVSIGCILNGLTIARMNRRARAPYVPSARPRP